MLRPPTRSPRTNPLLPYTSLFRSRVDGAVPGLGQCRALQRKRAPYGDGRTARGFVRGRGERDRRRRCQLVSPGRGGRSEEHTSELQSLMRISYAVVCLKKKNKNMKIITNTSLQHTLTLHK